jgi:hypothetical protein
VIGGLLSEVLPSVDLAHGDLGGSEQRPEQHGGGFGAGQHGLGLDPALELLVQALDRVRGSYRLPLARREADESEEFVAGLRGETGSLVKAPDIVASLSACGGR